MKQAGRTSGRCGIAARPLRRKRIQTTNGTVVTLAAPAKRRSLLGNRSLDASATFWLVTVIAGQSLFASYIATFYTLSAVHGQLGDKTKFFNHGYVAGDLSGNFAVAMHILFALVINLSGAIQLIPQLRRRAPAFHRWNGRVFLFGAVITGLAGLYMTWVRGSVGDLSQHLGTSLDAVLIFLCAALALRAALVHKIDAHRRWALRLFVVASGSWFLRISFFFWILVNRGPAGLDTATSTGPVLTAFSFGESLVPLAILELYLRVRDRAHAPGRFVMAGGIVAITLAMIAGIGGVAAFTWVPSVTAAYANLDSIVAPLDATIASRGVAAAVTQYYRLKATHPSRYDFSEGQLNALGYKLIGEKKFKDAIRVLALNVTVYPKSSNTYDSLGEAYMDDGDKTEAITHYRTSLRLDPHNENGRRMLAKLGVR